MKKFTPILIVCLFLSLHARAITFEANGITYDNFSSTVYEGIYLHVRVISVDNTVSGDVVIPEIPANYDDGSLYFQFRVSGIAAEAFKDRTDITSITIPGSADISSRAFSGCTGLKSVNITNHNGFNDRGIYAYAFENCTSLETVKISNSVNKIEDNAFSNCNGIVEFIVDDQNPSYVSADGVLYNKALTELVHYPAKKEGEFVILEGVETIAPTAIGVRTGLTSVTIPSTLTSGLENSVEIYTNAFVYCPNLTSFIVSESNPVYSSVDGIVYSKDRKTLITCPPAKSGNPLIIPDGVTAIGRFAFIHCKTLTAIDIPGSVTDIYYNSFRRCNNLTQLTVDGANQSFKSTDGVIYSKDGTRIVAYPPKKDGSSFTIPAGVTEIEDGSFMNSQNLTELKIPHGINTIGNYGMWDCPNLASLTIPSSVTSIGDAAFMDNVNLENVYVSWTDPASVEIIGYSTFYNIKPDATLHVPQGTKDAYQATFAWSFPNIIDDHEGSNIKKTDAVDIQMYPNPVQDGFYINGLSDNARLLLTDVSGLQLVSQPVENGSYISVNGLPKGVYIVKLLIGKEEIHQKIIKH